MTYTLVPAEREMTVQDLLRHTAGLAYGEITQNAPVKEAYAKAASTTPASTTMRGICRPPRRSSDIAKAPLAHQPGTVWEYSIATDMLGRVVEAASGKRLADFLDERLFKPLAMNDTGVLGAEDKLRRLAEPLPVDRAERQAEQAHRRVGGAEERFGRRRWRLDRRATICASRRCC